MKTYPYPLEIPCVCKAWEARGAANSRMCEIIGSMNQRKLYSGNIVSQSLDEMLMLTVICHMHRSRVVWRYTRTSWKRDVFARQEKHVGRLVQECVAFGSPFTKRGDLAPPSKYIWRCSEKETCVMIAALSITVYQNQTGIISVNLFHTKKRCGVLVMWW